MLQIQLFQIEIKKPGQDRPMGCELNIDEVDHIHFVRSIPLPRPRHQRIIDCTMYGDFHSIGEE